VLQECYACLPDKTLSFLLTVHQKFDVKWVMKIDDDVFLAPERLPHIIPQWDAVGADYIGCMKNGGVHGNADDKWYVATLVATMNSKCACMHACMHACIYTQEHLEGCIRQCAHKIKISMQRHFNLCKASSSVVNSLNKEECNGLYQ
jgi:hypothetical protein